VIEFGEADHIPAAATAVAVEEVFIGILRIPTKSNSIPEGSRTPFRDEAEQHSGMIPNTNRSVATQPF
jgi:hypothetical protein